MCFWARVIFNKKVVFITHLYPIYLNFEQLESHITSTTSDRNRNLIAIKTNQLQSLKAYNGEPVPAGKTSSFFSRQSLDKWSRSKQGENTFCICGFWMPQISKNHLIRNLFRDLSSLLFVIVLLALFLCCGQLLVWAAALSGGSFPVKNQTKSIPTPLKLFPINLLWYHGNWTEFPLQPVFLVQMFLLN